MIEAAETIAQFVSGRTRTDLETDRMLLFAIVRAIEVFGEAASKVSSEAKADTVNIPWTEIVAMRHRLVHGYFEINRNIVWKTATEEIPALLPALRKMTKA
jgi:uncharacterized protein with HEPN domain